MSDYIDRESAIKAMLTRYWDGKETLREIMNSVPAADVAPVVRCRNCVHYERWGEETGFCERDEIQGKPDFFCYYGAR